MVEMELLGVQVEVTSNLPMLLLREVTEARRVLPIYIDTPEARAIRMGIDRYPVERPMSHDLMKALLDEMGVSVKRVTVTELRDRTFFAEILLERDGESHTVSSRPSDAIVLAVRTGTPIFANEGVLDEAGQVLVDEGSEAEGEEDEELSPAESEELIAEFRSFIEDVSPEDFES